AAAQGTDEVVQRTNVPQFKPFATPGPRKIERDAEIGDRSQQACEFAHRRNPSGRNVAPHATNLADGFDELMDATFKLGLVRSKGRFQAFGTAFQHMRRLAQTEAKLAQGHDL